MTCLCLTATLVAADAFLRLATDHPAALRETLVGPIVTLDNYYDLLDALDGAVDESTTEMHLEVGVRGEDGWTCEYALDWDHRGRNLRFTSPVWSEQTPVDSSDAALFVAIQYINLIEGRRPLGERTPRPARTRRPPATALERELRDLHDAWHAGVATKWDFYGAVATAVKAGQISTRQISDVTGTHWSVIDMRIMP